MAIDTLGWEFPVLEHFDADKVPKKDLPTDGVLVNASRVSTLCIKR